MTTEHVSSGDNGAAQGEWCAWNADSGVSGAREPARAGGTVSRHEAPQQDAREPGGGSPGIGSLQIPLLSQQTQKGTLHCRTELGRGEATPRLRSFHPDTELALGLSPFQEKPGTGDRS